MTHLAFRPIVRKRGRETTVYVRLERQTAYERCARNAPVDMWKQLAGIGQVFPLKGDAHLRLVNFQQH